LETGCGPIDIYVVRVLEGFGTLPTPLQHKPLSYPKASSTSYPKASPTNNLSVKLSGKPNKHDLASTYISHQTGQM